MKIAGIKQYTVENTVYGNLIISHHRITTPPDEFIKIQGEVSSVDIQPENIDDVINVLGRIKADRELLQEGNSAEVS